MISLLSWLWNRAGRVYEIIGSLYAKVRSAAKYALNWAITQAWAAYQRAKVFVMVIVAAAKIVLKLAIDAAVGWLLDRIATAIALVWILFAAAKILARALIDAATEAIGKRIDKLNAKLVDLKDEIETKIKGWINGALNQFITILLPLILLKDKIKDLIATFEGGLLDALIDFFQRMYIFLSNFVERPLGMILGMLQGVILTFLSWVSAYSMGTLKYTLPAWPSWDEMEIPGPSGPNPRPPSGSGNLGKPLSGLYVSGHRYGPGHRGIDFGLASGQSVFAAHDARVESIGFDSKGYGHYLTIRSDKWWTRYAHLEQVTVSRGQRIDRGQTIARGDSTGNSSGPHLHFEVKHRGKFVDPLTVLSL